MPRCHIFQLISLKWIALVLTLLGAGPAAWSQTTVVVPNAFEGIEAPGFSPFPLGHQAPARYQQVYDASQFGALTEPRVLTEVAFRRDGAFPGPVVSLLPDVLVTLSTTAAAPDALSGTFDANTGADATLVYAGPLQLSGGAETPPLFDLAIPLSTPFVYDSAAGNLLLDIVSSAAGSTFFQSDMVQQFDSVSRVFAGSPGTQGLVTQFTFQDPTVSPIAALVRVGDPAPDTGGETFSNFGVVPDIDAAGKVAFMAYTSGGTPGGETTGDGIFLSDPLAAVTALALAGDPAPGTPDSFEGFLDPSMNDVGDVVFQGFTRFEPSRSEGIFVYDAAGVGSARALTGQVAPGAGGGTFSEFGNAVEPPPGSSFDTFPSINDAGDVTFFASITGGSATQGIFVVDAAGVASARALQGQSAPDTGGKAYGGFRAPPTTPGSPLRETNPSINAAGDVAFYATLSGGGEGLFVVDAAGVGSARVLTGDPAPGTVGTFVGFEPYPFINDAGAVAFIGFIAGGSILGGLFVVDAAGVVTARLLGGDVAPGGGLFTGILGPSAFDNTGRIGFYASTNGAFPYGAFLVDAAGGLGALALPGAEAPVIGGGVYDPLVAFPGLGNAGGAVYRSGVTGGTTTGALFAPEPGGLLMLGSGVALLLGLRRARARHAPELPLS